MRFSLFRRASLSQRPSVSPEVGRDADELIQLWGAAAHERASELSWKEDSGLFATSRPGHWWRVRREIGRRLGQQDREPIAEFAA